MPVAGSPLPAAVVPVLRPVVLPPLTLTMVLLPTAAAFEAERVLAVALAPELLDDAPLPIGLPITFTRGFEIDCDCEPDVVFTFALLSDPDCEFWAAAASPSIASAVAARRICLIEALLRVWGGLSAPSARMHRDGLLPA